MKQWLIIITLLLLLLATGFFVVYKVAAPKAIQSFVPAKWQNIPLGEKRAFIHEYLGAPRSGKPYDDSWEERLTDTKKYVLGIRYRSDSTAFYYYIRYEVKLLGFLQTTDVITDSFR